jgi:signal transduction histidine kinase/putative methionine-R-sulfoxide reductase with GAF domain
MIRKQGEMDELPDLIAGERNMMSVPMFVGDSSVGAIRLSNKQDGFDAHDVQVLSMMADRLAALLEHGQLYHTLQARHAEISLLYRVSVPRSSSLDFDGALSESVDVVQSLLAGEEVSLFLVDESGETLHLFGSSMSRAPDQQSIRVALGEGTIGRVAVAGESALVVHEEGVLSPLPPPTRVQSELCVPLKLGSWVIGVVHAQSRRPHAFEQKQLRLLEIVAGQLASHLQSARLYEATRQRAAELSSLYDATVAMSRAGLDRSGIAELVIERLIGAISADGGYLGLWNAISNKLETRLVQGLTIADSQSSVTKDRPLKDLLWRSVLADRRPLVLYDNDPQLEPSLLATMQKRGIRSALILPLVTHNRMTGLVELTKETPHRFSQGEIRLALTLATQAAVVMENARLFQETKLAVEELAALQALALDITAQVTLPELLERLMMRARHLVRASGSIIYLGDRRDDPLDAVGSDLPWPDREAIISHQGQHLAREVIESGRTLVRTLESQLTPAGASASSTAFDTSFVLHSAAVPLRWREKVVGVLTVFRGTDVLPFSGQQVYLLELLAPQAAIAIRNVQLYEALEQGMKDLEEAQTNLVQAEKAAAIGRLTASLAHEINNPLQSLNNCLHLSLRPELSAEKKEVYLSLAQDEMERLIEIVNRMLNFYRPAAAETRSETSVNRLLTDVLALVSKQLEHRNVEVELELDPALPHISAIANNLLQVFMNLILNAVDAMPDGGRLTVATALLEGDRVEVTIKDTGRGIAPEDISRIYEPFFTTKDNGTGLGLSITYGIIEAHDGEISVDSTLDVGSTFSIVLPVGRLDNG